MEKLRAFNKQDADYLISTIPGSGTTVLRPEDPFRFHMLLAKTGVGGIATNSSATVTVRVPTTTGWTDTSTEYTAYNQHPTAAVAGGTIVVLAPIDGRWVVIAEMCA